MDGLADAEDGWVESSPSAFSEAGSGAEFGAVDFVDGDFAALVDEEVGVDFETELGGDVCGAGEDFKLSRYLTNMAI